MEAQLTNTGFSPLLSVTVSFFLPFPSLIIPPLPLCDLFYLSLPVPVSISSPQSILFYFHLSLSFNSISTSLSLPFLSLLHFLSFLFLFFLFFLFHFILLFLPPLLPPAFPPPSLLHRPHSPHHRAAGLYSEALCALWKIFPGVLQPKR